MDSTNAMTNGVCVYGDQGVSVQGDNCHEGNKDADGNEEYTPCTAPAWSLDNPPPFSDLYTNGDIGTEVIMKTKDPPNWIEGSEGSNPGFEAAQEVGYEVPVLASRVGDFIADVHAGFDGLVDGTGTWVASEYYDYEGIANSGVAGVKGTWPPTGSEQLFTWYDIPGGDVVIKDGDWKNFAIRAKTIKLEAGWSVENVILIATEGVTIDGNVKKAIIASGEQNSPEGKGWVSIGSDVEIGDPVGNGIGDATHCSETTSVVFFAMDKLNAGSFSRFKNSHLITRGGIAPLEIDSIDLQSNVVYDNTTVQTLGPIKMGSENLLSGCPLPDDSGGGGGPGPLTGYVRLVK